MTTTRAWEGVNTPTLQVMAEKMRRIVATPEHADPFDRAARAARAANHRAEMVALAEMEAELERREATHEPMIAGWCHEPAAHGLCPGTVVVDTGDGIDGHGTVPCECPCHSGGATR